MTTGPELNDAMNAELLREEVATALESLARRVREGCGVESKRRDTHFSCDRGNTYKRGIETRYTIAGAAKVTIWGEP